MLTKPTQQVAHGGGLRFEINSDYYKTIYNWIAQGVPYRRSRQGLRRSSLEVEPKEIFMEKPGGTVTRENRRDVQRRRHARRYARSEHRQQHPGCRTVGHGRGHQRRAHRRGHSAGPLSGQIRDRPGYRSQSRARLRLEAAAQNNYIDQLIDAKLQRLKIQPSRAGGRRRLPAPRFAGSDRPVAGPQRDSRVSSPIRRPPK